MLRRMTPEMKKKAANYMNEIYKRRMLKEMYQSDRRIFLAATAQSFMRRRAAKQAFGL